MSSFSILRDIVIAIAFFIAVFLIRIVFPMWRFQRKKLLAFNLYNMVQGALELAKEHEEYPLIKEIEFWYNPFNHFLFNNIIEAYDKVNEKCDEAINYHNKLSTVITSRNIYIKQLYALNTLKETVNSEKMQYAS